MFKSGFAAIVGRPSSGKSTLINSLCHAKVSIVSPTPQTTRNSIRGIVNRADGQVVFVDTPGFHLSLRAFNQRLMNVAMGAIQETDVVLYLLDGNREPGEEEKELCKKILTLQQPIVVAINKIDVHTKATPAVRDFAQTQFPKHHVYEISALCSTGLDTLFDAILALCPEGEPWYPPEFYTDQDPIFRIAEIIREKAVLFTSQEVPHSLYIEYIDSTKKQDGSLSARFDIITQRESQQRILIGKGGSMVGKIREHAERDLASLFDFPIILSLKVRCDPHWKSNKQTLDNLIH